LNSFERKFTKNRKKIKNILSVDVEDWFHILELDSTPESNKWQNFESRVEKNLHFLLDMFDHADAKATFFFLGWIAQHYPGLVKETYLRGHEVASHGYSHRLIYSQSIKEFEADVRRSKDILEDIIGQPIVGYRAPGFSLIEETKWAFNILTKVGFSYDSSIFPAIRGHGGIVGANVFPHEIKTENGRIKEFPITVAFFFKKKICFFGGGYLRLFPYPMIRHYAKAVNKEGRPVIYYLHPREIDPQHPRLRMGFIRYFKSYVNLNRTLPKLKKLLNEQKLTSFSEFIF
jgi:polysaccharide deacetylase family protein (PEP-CTERM system associated)